MQLGEFINTYQGQPNVGDTDLNLGQCVGLIEVWTDNLGLVHTWGNAVDLLTNADRGTFNVIYNTPDGVPSPGDIFCFDSYYGGGYGHTGIVVSADLNTVNLFQQNDPDGSAPHLKGYSYDHAIGWLHPYVLDAPQPVSPASTSVPETPAPVVPSQPEVVLAPLPEPAPHVSPTTTTAPTPPAPTPLAPAPTPLVPPDPTPTELSPTTPSDSLVITPTVGWLGAFINALKALVAWLTGH